MQAEQLAILRAQLESAVGGGGAAAAKGKKRASAAAPRKGPSAKARAAEALRRVAAEAAAAARRADGVRLRMQQRPFEVEKGCASAQRVAARLAAQLAKRG